MFLNILESHLKVIKAILAGGQKVNFVIVINEVSIAGTHRYLFITQAKATELFHTAEVLFMHSYI